MLASALHEDPRFYPEDHPTFGHAVKYSVQRVFVTRNDDGHDVMNVQGLLGPAMAEGLANVYWPDRNRTVGDTLLRYGLDLATKAGGNMLREYWPVFYAKIHHASLTVRPTNLMVREKAMFIFRVRIAGCASKGKAAVVAEWWLCKECQDGHCPKTGRSRLSNRILLALVFFGAGRQRLRRNQSSIVSTSPQAEGWALAATTRRHLSATLPHAVVGARHELQPHVRLRRGIHVLRSRFSTERDRRAEPAGSKRTYALDQSGRYLQ